MSTSVLRRLVLLEYRNSGTFISQSESCVTKNHVNARQRKWITIGLFKSTVHNKRFILNEFTLSCNYVNAHLGGGSRSEFLSCIYCLFHLIDFV